MGGHSGGAMAAEQVLMRARQNFEAYAPLHETPEHLLRSIIDEAHVVIKLTRFTSEQDPHSTAVVFMMQQGKAYWAHCGDSRMYHFRGTRTMSVSSDHSLVAELVRKGRLDDRAALRHPQRNVLLSCLGSDREPRIDYGRDESPLAGDCFLLCSDGLWAHFTDFELASTLQEFPARAAAERLVALGRERAGGSGDNISLAIVKLIEAPATSARPAASR
ncbi:MAG TPA: serine/threonine-protein phosphatase, partial [Thauera aminoaromatica]|nr:serine/threonine-protein phosphatase [Thauera aminoaromatica]